MSVKAIVKEYVENEGVEYKGVFPHFIKHSFKHIMLLLVVQFDFELA